MNGGEPLALDHANELTALLDRLASPFSEYRFANLYLFRQVHDYRFERGDLPRITGVTYDGIRHALPLVPLGDAETITALLDGVDCLFPIEARPAAAAKALGFAMGWNEDDSDYLYESARLAALAGPVMKAKRSQAKAFAAEHRPVVEALGDATRDKALALLDAWLGDVARPRGATDHDACREAILRQQALGLEGIIVCAGAGEPQAMLIAGPQRGNARVVHFAKARRALAGAHGWAVAQFAAHAGAAYLNFEQDLGHAGFRQAKRAFDPVTLLRKYRISRPA